MAVSAMPLPIETAWARRQCYERIEPSIKKLALPRILRGRFDLPIGQSRDQLLSSADLIRAPHERPLLLESRDRIPAAQHALGAQGVQLPLDRVHLLHVA